MAQAYEFALNNMGMDFASSSIYNDYIMFVKNFDAAGSSYAENQKISAIRRIYHRGVIIPMLNVENLWYEKYEFNNLKSITTTLTTSLRPFTFYSFLHYYVSLRLMKRQICFSLCHFLLFPYPVGSILLELAGVVVTLSYIN